MVAPIDPRCVSDVSGGESADHGIAWIAARQHGLITTRQLKALGFTDTAIHRRVRRGALHRVHRGVFRVGHSSPELSSDLLAAVIASGPSAALSHLAAARLWGLVPDHGPMIDVTARSGLRRRAGINIHRSPPSAAPTSGAGSRFRSPPLP